MKVFRLALTAVLACASVRYVASNPSGAGGCPANVAAPSGPHDTQGATTGSLLIGGFSVTVGDGKTPSVINKRVTVSTLNFDVVVTAASGKHFKGILIRVGNTQPHEVIPQGGDLKVATVCNGVGSATHNSKSEKVSATATIDLDDFAPLDLDISVVVQNSGGVSIYYYTGYKVIVDPDGKTGCRDGLLFRQQCGPK
jgi:hypothetical protein